MFHLITPGRQTGSPLTDDGWLGFVQRLGRQLDQMDVEQRRQSDQQRAYWNERHQYAVERLAKEKNKTSIDELVYQRISIAKKNAGDPKSFFNQHVRPIFVEHCYRCHSRPC